MNGDCYKNVFSLPSREKSLSFVNWLKKGRRALAADALSAARCSSTNLTNPIYTQHAYLLDSNIS